MGAAATAKTEWRGRSCATGGGGRDSGGSNCLVGSDRRNEGRVRRDGRGGGGRDVVPRPLGAREGLEPFPSLKMEMLGTLLGSGEAAHATLVVAFETVERRCNYGRVDVDGRGDD